MLAAIKGKLIQQFLAKAIQRAHKQFIKTIQCQLQAIFTMQDLFKIQRLQQINRQPVLLRMHPLQYRRMLKHGLMEQAAKFLKAFANP